VAVRFECATKLAMPPAEAFDLSLSVAAHVAAMAHSRERAVGRLTSDLLALGDEVTWRAWHFGLPWQLTSRITAFSRPNRFVDEQVRGPFHRFQHEHLFEPFDGGSQMTDIVEFEAPAGWLGRLAERWVLASYMQTLIEERNRYISARSSPQNRP
jgi:ligand-binding SRPBCC domain-containing protein